METRKTVNIGSALADYISEMDYGTVIHYQDIERVINERRKTQRYYQAVAKAKTILEEKGKMIKSIGGGDYQVLYPGDYATAYTREIRLAKSRVKHGGKILDGAPTGDMTVTELQSFNNVSDFHRRMEASIVGHFAEVKKLTGKVHPLKSGVN